MCRREQKTEVGGQRIGDQGWETRRCWMHSSATVVLKNYRRVFAPLHRRVKLFNNAKAVRQAANGFLIQYSKGTYCFSEPVPTIL